MDRDGKELIFHARRRRLGTSCRPRLVNGSAPPSRPPIRRACPNGGHQSGSQRYDYHTYSVSPDGHASSYSNSWGRRAGGPALQQQALILRMASSPRPTGLPRWNKYPRKRRPCTTPESGQIRRTAGASLAPAKTARARRPGAAGEYGGASRLRHWRVGMGARSASAGGDAVEQARLHAAAGTLHIGTISRQRSGSRARTLGSACRRS